MFLRRLASVVIYPRTTMRAILEEPRDRMVVLLALLAITSGLVSNGNENVSDKLANASPAIWLVVVCVLLAVAAVMLGLFYFFAWIAFLAGRFLEGTGDLRRVRSALAWGCAPLIWALIYRIPAAILTPSKGLAQVGVGNNFRIQPGQMSGGCVAALVIGLLELATFVAYLVVSSRTLAEAHRYSAWRGFGTLVIVGITPVVIIIAGVLAIH